MNISKHKLIHFNQNQLPPNQTHTYVTNNHCPVSNASGLCVEYMNVVNFRVQQQTQLLQTN